MFTDVEIWNIMLILSLCLIVALFYFTFRFIVSDKCSDRLLIVIVILCLIGAGDAFYSSSFETTTSAYKEGYTDYPNTVFYDTAKEYKSNHAGLLYGDDMLIYWYVKGFEAALEDDLKNDSNLTELKTKLGMVV